jgi:hypothetical protein
MCTIRDRFIPGFSRMLNDHFVVVAVDSLVTSLG